MLFWCLLPLCSNAQPYVMMDRQLAEPIRIHESLSLDDLAGGAFPVYAQDVDPLVITLDSLARHIGNGAALPDAMETSISPHCSVLLWHQSEAANQGLTLVIRVSSPSFSTPLHIAAKSNRKYAVRRLKQVADYLRNNRGLAHYPK
ncbi:hypothetical protein SAMN05444008_12320 [Cnuella takakiae]|uniref:Uncharacterized protein n=2 Tax=Cnuella takakiae TaxID=1302690 RepID=A0A1M5IBZ4_9BACT|nr:hypothetical protein SAMN05444008_12320 [Cnuella takakiae]